MASQHQSSIRVVVAESVPLLLLGLEHLIGSGPDLVLAGRFPTADELIAALDSLEAEVLIIDLRLEGSALRAVSEVRRRVPSIHVILLATDITDRELTDAVRLGVHGVVMLDMPTDVILRCVRKVAEGQEWVETKSLSRAFHHLVDHQGLCGVDALTPREYEIARLVAAGYRNREIAEKLFITEGTVKGHLTRMYEKLDVRNRVDLLRAVTTGSAPHLRRP